jgi:hypothetical protein
MEHLRRLGLETRARARQLQLSSGVDTTATEREGAATAQLDELLQLTRTARVPEDEGAPPTGRAVLLCIQRLKSNDAAGEPPDHVEQRRDRTHQWLDAMVDAAPRLREVDPGVARRAHEAIDDAYRLVGKMRKPGVIAAACLALAIRRCTLEDLRCGEPADGCLYRAIIC